MKKAVVLLALLIAGGVAKVGAEEVTGTVLFEPKKDYNGQYTYYLSTNKNKVADKSTTISRSLVGDGIEILQNYLVPGSQIVYENKGMKNISGEFIKAERLIAIITEDGTYIGLEEIISMFTISWNLPYLYDKLSREGRTR